MIWLLGSCVSNIESIVKLVVDHFDEGVYGSLRTGDLEGYFSIICDFLHFPTPFRLTAIHYATTLAIHKSSGDHETFPQDFYFLTSLLNVFERMLRRKELLLKISQILLHLTPICLHLSLIVFLSFYHIDIKVILFMLK